MKKRINNEIIRIARESRGLTQGCLAERLSVTQGKVSKMESGLLGVSEDMLDKLSNVLSYPQEFFYFNDEIYGHGISMIGELYYRKRKNIPDKVIDKISARINIRRLHLVRLLRSIEIKDDLFETFHFDEYNGDVVRVAQAVRATWLLPRGPIKNLIKAIEDAGGIVIEFDFETDKIDATSQWLPDLPPLFFINKNSPADRLRFSLAHELGHVVMHKICKPDLDLMEREANNFASEFLMPKSDIAQSLNNIDLPQIANLKPYWKVSMAALLHRAFDLKKITSRQYQYFWMQMGKAGYRTKEPPEYDIPKERPALLKEIIDTYRYKLGYTSRELSLLLGLHEDEAASIYLNNPNPHGLTLVK